jgi:hypothetical protein
MGTYVNNLRLLEITTGDESGTWGTKTNTNLELIADAFGSGTEAITTNADTHTTTIADGAADEGRALFLKYTGTLDSACTITIAPNTVNKLWFIENATSGSQNIIISQGSGANITIGNGKVAAVYTDGAGSGAAVLDVFADLEISSTLTVAGNVTMSADATVGDDLTLLSDAAVLGFGADTDVTLTHVADTGLLLNSTMAIQFNDASQYINAPSNAILDINATDEIELNATLADVNANLDVSGTIVGASTIEGTTITATTAFVPDASDGASLGTAALEFSDLFLADGGIVYWGDDQEISIVHEHNTGLQLNGTNQFQFGDSGTYIHQSADGVLDLVSDTEIELNATTIDINGAVDISGDTSIGTDFLTVADGITTIGGTDTSKLRFHNAAGTLRSFLTLNGTSLEIDTDSAIIFSANNSERARIDDSGRLGLGTSAPHGYYSVSNKFVIANTSGSTGMTFATSNTGQARIDFAEGTSGGEQYRGTISYVHAETEANGYMRFVAGEAEALRLGSNYILMANLPTSDPGVANSLYNDSGTLKISAG